MGRTEVIEFTEEFEDADSTSIEHVWYNANTERLTIKFRHSGTYSYDGVDADLYNDFASADSLGSFFHSIFTPKNGEKWPGAKHDERRTEFRAVEVEDPEIEPDLDALKPQAITGGKGKEFKLHFTYSAKGEMTVRAPDVEQAVTILNEYLHDHGFKVEKVHEVTIKL